MEDSLGKMVYELYHHSRKMPPSETENSNNWRPLPQADELSDKDFHLKDLPSYREENPLVGINTLFSLESGLKPCI
jgi:hypothetical protein